MSYKYPITISNLSPREAAVDPLYRFVNGLDANNRELLESSMVEGKDTAFVIMGNRSVEGTDAIKEYIYNKVMPLHTTHFITNVRVDLKDGADTAYVTATVLACHYKAEDAFLPERKAYATAGLYYMDMVKDSSSGLWKIKKWTLKMNWTEGDRSIMMG